MVQYVIKLINNNLAAEKLSTAKFYFSKGNYNGSLNYLKDIFAVRLFSIKDSNLNFYSHKK